MDTDIDPLIDAAISGNTFTNDEIHGGRLGVIQGIVASGDIRPDSVGADDLRSLGNLPEGLILEGDPRQMYGTKYGMEPYGKQKPRKAGFVLELAEREGFEPSVGYKPTPDFESGTFNRSATSPESGP